MLRYFIRRIMLLLITLLILNLIAFLLDRYQVGGMVPVTGNPIILFGQFLWNNIHGHLGVSHVTGRPVMQEILQVFPATLELCFSAFILSLIIGIPLGTISGLFRRHWIRRAILSLTVIGYSIPVFWLAILCIMYFSLELGWFPVAGRFNPLFPIPHVTGFGIIDALLMPNDQMSSIALWSVIHHLILPALVLAILPTTEVIKQLSTAMTKVMQENYIKAAALKGLSKTEIVLRHALRNTLPTIFPTLGLQFGSVLTMAMVMEMVFSWPGIGRWLITAVYEHDYIAIRGGMLVVASFVICATILTDLFTALTYPIRRKEIYEQL
ncbi:ABC transporter permease [Celerinatantimonas yamalensis]|uniref:ABC transporter permease subunit n=1 Tax=Celerinatantimonas yamalensis TaxID=559956 RepID=A0ABW9G3W2_9GAMM